MTRAVVALATAAIAWGSIACQSIAGLGEFVPDDGGGSPSSGPAGGGGGGGSSASSTGGGDAGTTTSSSSSSSVTTTTSSTGSGEVCAGDHLLLAEIRTRGPDGGNQDFVEILNPTGTAVVLDAQWRLMVRGEGAETYGPPRWSGDGLLTIGPGERVLLANSTEDNPLGGAVPDAEYGSGISDGASVVLYRSDVVVDAVCFLCDENELSEGHVCEGDPLRRVAGCGAAGDRSVRRRSVAGVEGCADTGDNEADLEEATPSTPQGLGG